MQDSTRTQVSFIGSKLGGMIVILTVECGLQAADLASHSHCFQVTAGQTEGPCLVTITSSGD